MHSCLNCHTLCHRQSVIAIGTHREEGFCFSAAKVVTLGRISGIGVIINRKLSNPSELINWTVLLSVSSGLPGAQEVTSLDLKIYSCHIQEMKDETDTTYIVSQKTTSRPASNAPEARCMDPTAGSAVAGSSVTERLA